MWPAASGQPGIAGNDRRPAENAARRRRGRSGYDRRPPRPADGGGQLPEPELDPDPRTSGSGSSTRPGVSRRMIIDGTYRSSIPVWSL